MPKLAKLAGEHRFKNFVLYSFALFEAREDSSSSDEDETDVTIIKDIACNYDEETLMPSISCHQHTAKNYYRQTIMMEVLARFKCNAGAWKVHFDKNDKKFRHENEDSHSLGENDDAL